MNAHALAEKVRGAQKSGNGHLGFCPAHDDREHRSLSFRDTDGKVLMKCHAGCTVEAIVAALGLTMRDLFHDADEQEAGATRRIEHIFDYLDENGHLLFQVVREKPKKFRQRQPDGAGGWIWNAKGVRRVPYNLPAILEFPNKTTIFHEGEKAVEAAVAAGLPGIHTTTAGGASNWKQTDLSVCAGRNTVICPDNDAPGEKYASGIAERLHGIAATVKILRWPSVPEHGDCVEWLDRGGTPADFQGLCDTAPLYTRGPSSAESDKPELNCDEGDLDELTKEAWKIIAARNSPPVIFKRGNSLVRVEEDSRGVVLAELTEVRGRYEVARLARCQKTKSTMFGAGKLEDCKPPMDLIRNLLATPTQAIPLPELRSVIEVPVVSASGKIVSTPGYDAESKLLYRPYDPAANISTPVKSTQKDVQNARSVIDDLFTDFPFASEADRTHAVGLLLLPFVRQYIKGPAPMHLVEAPEAGSGKGLLVHTALCPAVGVNIGVIADARDDDEMRKRITARMVEGCPVTLLDNLNRPLTSGALAAALTAPRWDDRRLGTLEVIRVPITTLWVVTGNNPVMSLELARRAVRVRLDPKIDRPWLRNGWRHSNLLQFVREKRAEFIAAALTLARAWLDAGEPAPSAQPLGSFEDWTRVIGGIVQHAGYEDFMGNANELYEVADSDGATWRTFTTIWWEVHRDQAVTAKDLFNIATDLDGLNLGKSASERGQRTALGAQLRKRRDQVIGNFRIESAGIEHNAALWRLRQINKPATPPFVPSPPPSSADELLFEEETC